MINSFKSALRMAAVASLFLSITQPGFAGVTPPSPAPASKVVAIGLNDVFVPGGFDSTADSYVVANGLFPNGCYKWKGADVKHVSTFNHEVQTYADVSQGLCIMVLIPFSKEIRLGRLSTGTHTLKFLNGDGTYLEKSLVIE
jgi:hypothetical protein